MIEALHRLGSGRPCRREPGRVAQAAHQKAVARNQPRELRELLGAWRDAKRSARNAVVAWLVRGVLALVLIAVAVRTGFADRVFGG